MNPDPLPLYPNGFNGHLWKNIGYVISAIWMVGVLVITGSDTKHALFRYIFLVPLAGWILGLIIGALLKRHYAKRGG